MANLNPISVKQARITASFYPQAFWSSKKGGTVKSDEVAYQDTNLNIGQTLAGTVKIENITLSKVHDPVADSALIAAITALQKAPKAFSVTVQPVKSDVQGTALGKLTTYPNCQLLSFVPPDYDREGSGVAMLSITVAVNSMPTF